MVRVVTTTTQLTDFVRVVGGDRVQVYAVVKANVDPHDYEPSPADVKAIADADVVVQNGIGLEKWFARTVKSASPKGEVVVGSQGARIRKDDPHLWHDPTNAKVMRAGMGATFRLPTAMADEAEFRAWIERTRPTVWAAALEGTLLARVPRPERLVLIVGSEGAGIRPAVAELAATRVAIPLARGAESLNVAVAAGIILHEVQRGG